MTPGDHLTAARLAARLERAGVELALHDGANLIASGETATLDRVLVPAIREEIARLKPALVALLDQAAPLVPGLTSRAFSALVRLDPAWAAIPARQRVSPSPGTRCVHCEKPCEYRFLAIPVHPACYFARANPHVFELPEGVSCCSCALCEGGFAFAPPTPPTPTLPTLDPAPASLHAHGNAPSSPDPLDMLFSPHLDAGGPQ